MRDTLREQREIGLVRACVCVLEEVGVCGRVACDDSYFFECLDSVLLFLCFRRISTIRVEH